MHDDIYTYFADQVRPNCPHCGTPVVQPDEVHDPEKAWVGYCSKCGVTETFQMEDEDHDQD